MPHLFLSPEWIDAARAIRAQHRDAVTTTLQSIRINQIITDVPFGDGPVESHLDTTSGQVDMDLGHLPDPDVTITTDYDTARLIFVDQNAAAVMEAFMSGKIKVQGDMMKLVALQTTLPQDDAGRAIAEEIKAITA